MTPTPTTLRIHNINGSPSELIPSTLINQYSAMAIPAFKRAIAFLADNLASFSRSVRLQGASAEEADQAHPLDALLQVRPNEYQNPFILWRTWFAHAAHPGNGYLHIERDPRTMRPIAFHNLLPEDILPFRFWADGASSPAQYYMVRSTKKILPAADVLHLQTLGHDGIAGTDHVAQHESTFQLAHTLGKFQTQFLQKGTIIRGSVEIPGSMTDEELEQFTAHLRRHFYGSDSDRDVLLLTDGAKLNNATIKPQEAELIKQAAITTKQIAQITGVPPEFLYELSEAKYNASVEQAGQNVVRYTFRPWITQAEQEMSTKLLTTDELQQGYRVKINPDALLRGDTAAVNKSAIDTKNAGLRTPNESRQILGLPRLDDPEADKLSTLGASTPASPKPDPDPNPEPDPDRAAG